MQSQSNRPFDTLCAASLKDRNTNLISYRYIQVCECFIKKCSDRAIMRERPTKQPTDRPTTDRPAYREVTIPITSISHMYQMKSMIILSLNFLFPT